MVEQAGAGTKTINDFEIVRVGPFSEMDGRAFINGLLKKEGGISDVPAAAINLLMKTIGPPVPYFLQILLRECLYLLRSNDPAFLTETLIEKAYQECVLGPANRTYFQHYYTRLKEYYDRATWKSSPKDCLSKWPGKDQFREAAFSNYSLQREKENSAKTISAT